MQTLAARLGLVGGSLVVSLLLLEGALRIVYPAPVRFLYPQESYDFDPEIGHVLRPSQTAFTHDRSVHTNTLGLRDREFSPYPAPATLRVLALGDSQTFGNGLDLADTWPKQLEQRLQALDGAMRWEIVNGGIPGTDTWQQEIALGRLLDTLHPRAVVLGLYVNDVTPRYDVSRADAVGQTNTGSKRLAYLLKRSALVTWLYYGVVLPWQARRTGDSSTEDAVVAGRDNERAERGWRQVERSLAGMKDRCDSRTVMFLVALLPRRDQVSGQNPARGYNARALAIAEKHGIAIVDLQPDLAAEYSLGGTSLFIPWDGHNGAAANRVIAERLATRLASATTERARRRP